MITYREYLMQAANANMQVQNKRTRKFPTFRQAAAGAHNFYMGRLRGAMKRALVTQADRDAAASTTVDHRFRASILEGSVDDGRLVQAFARHRLASPPSSDAKMTQLIMTPHAGVHYVEEAGIAAPSYITNCYFKRREGDDSPYLFRDDQDGNIIVHLNGYAIVPADEYHALTNPSSDAVALREALERMVDACNSFPIFNRAVNLAHDDLLNGYRRDCQRIYEELMTQATDEGW